MGNRMETKILTIDFAIVLHVQERIVVDVAEELYVRPGRKNDQYPSLDRPELTRTRHANSIGSSAAAHDGRKTIWAVNVGDTRISNHSE